MRRLGLITLFLMLAAPSWAMEHYTHPLQNEHGKAIGNATVTVYNAGTAVKATIYSDNGVTTKANPFQSNTFTGLVDFYAANGVYDLVFSKPGYTFTSASTARIALFDVNDFSGGGGGGSSAFTDLTSGANTIAAMVVSTGASLTFAGLGTINANQFNGSAIVSVSAGGTGLSSASDDTVLLGNGSAYVATALPSCNNAVTSKLLYDTNTNSFSCGTDQSSGGGTTFDAIGGGTNTTAPMIVGSGASLVPSGTGIIAATSSRPTVTTVNAGNSPYSPVTSDALLLCDTTAGARVISLPAASARQAYYVKNLGANTCTINRAGADTIDGGTSAILRTIDESILLIADSSTEWQVF